MVDRKGFLSVDSCYNNNTRVSGDYAVGGLVGAGTLYSTINALACNNHGRITARYSGAGGIVGSVDSLFVSGCRNMSAITGGTAVMSDTTDNGGIGAGGIAGGTGVAFIYSSFNEGKIEGAIGVGGIIGSTRIGKAAQDVLRLRRVCNAREAGIAVEDDRQILTADGLRGAERVRAAAVDHAGVIGPEDGLRIVGTGRDIAEGHVRAGRIRCSGDAVHDGRNHGAVQRQIGGKARVRFAAAGGEYCYTIAARTGEILDVQRPATPGKPDDSAAPAGSEISISEALSRVLQELGISLPDIRDVNVQRVQVSGRDAYHITFTANGKPYSFYVGTHDGDLF